MIQANNRHTEQFEEIANISTSFLGLFFSLIGFSILISLATLSKQWLPIISSAIYGTTLLLLFMASILYHSSLATDMVHKKAFQVVDHCAIYLLIAGSFTPMGLITLREHGGLYLLAFLWITAFVGCLHKIFFPISSEIPSTLAYIAMGWSLIFVIKPMWATMDHWGVCLIILGGLFYTVGSIFYVFDHKFKLAHAIWHFFVLGGSVAHYLAILLYVTPGSIQTLAWG